MPLYEYRCTNCHHVFEKFHEVGGSPGPCPNCGGTPQRIFTSVGLIFKGSGFHTTDYRKLSGDGQSRDGQSGDGGAAKEPGGKSEKGAEATAKTES